MLQAKLLVTSVPRFHQQGQTFEWISPIFFYLFETSKTTIVIILIISSSPYRVYQIHGSKVRMNNIYQSYHFPSLQNKRI